MNKQLYYKQYLIPTKIIPDDGYVLTKRTIDHIETYNIYCEEVNIINKIKNNEEGYFDFSKNMIDIGCEHGSYSFILSFNHSYLFDGNKEKLVLAQFNMLLHNKLDQGSFYCTLLSDKQENIQYNGFCTSYSTYFNEPLSQTLSSSILDLYNFNNIGFIKVDVEGMEYKVLKGGLGTIIRNNYPPILFELWDIGKFGMTKENHDLLQKLLEDLGYEIFWYWGDHETHLAIHKSQLNNQT